MPGRWWIGRHAEEIHPDRSFGSFDPSPLEIPWNCAVLVDETTRFDVPAPPIAARLRGRLRFGGEAAINWRVQLGRIGAPAHMSESPLDVTGHFEIAAAEAGDYWLQLYPGGFEFGATGAPRSLRVPISLQIGTHEWELDLPIGTLAGQTPIDPSGRTRYSWEWTGEQDIWMGGRMQPGSDGSFVETGVPAGRLTLRRRAPGLPEDVREVELAAGQTLKLEF
jgi:hypothetical protein